MRRSTMIVVLVLLAGTISRAQNVSNYLYFTEFETTEIGEIIWFWTPDHLRGPVRSNDQIAIKGSPTFYDSVITSAPAFLEYSNFDPDFLGPDPLFNAIPLVDPLYVGRLDSTAVAAQEQGYYYPDFEAMRQTRIVGTPNGWRVVQWDAGVPYPEDEDDLLIEDMIEYGERCIFVEGRLELAGEYIEGTTYLANSGTMRLIDNVQYADLRDYRDVAGILALDDDYDGDHQLALISGQDILVANTEANGQGNGGMSGPDDDPSNKHILISARLEVPNGSFTFENQNNDPEDPNGWDGYWWCDPDGQHAMEPDERGRIILYGSLAQLRRGYVHRSNCNGTGYDKAYLYDSRFRQDEPLGYIPIEVDLSNGDVEWRDTTIVVRETDHFIDLIGDGQLTIGPGTEIIQHVPAIHHGHLFRGDNLVVAGEEGNPVVFQFIQAGDVFYQPFEPGQIVEGYTSYVNFRGTRLELDLPYYLQFCDFNAEEITISTSYDFNHVENCRFKGTIEFTDPIHRLNRTIFDGTLTTPRILYGENCVFAQRPGVEGDSIAIDLRNHTGRLDRLSSVYFQGYYTTLVETRSRVRVRYSAWSSTRPRAWLFDSGTEFEGVNLDAAPAQFWNPTGGDYHIQWNSPLIDTGDPELPLDPDGSRADIGVFPYDPTYVDAPESGPETIQPLAFGIESLYPNPFNGMTTLSLTLPHSGEVEVTVYDLLGRQVQQMKLGTLGGGQQQVSVSLEHQSSGIYFIDTRFDLDHTVVKALLVQ